MIVDVEFEEAEIQLDADFEDVEQYFDVEFEEVDSQLDADFGEVVIVNIAEIPKEYGRITYDHNKVITVS